MAKHTLTAKFLESVKTDKTQEDIWDTKVRGFGIRVTPQGRKSWFVFYRFRGRKTRQTLGTYPALPLHDARQAALDTLRKVFSDQDPGQKRTTLFFRDLASRYLTEHAKVQKRSWPEDERTMNKDLLPILGDLPTDQIFKRDIVVLLDGICARGAKIQPNRVLALARKVFNFGIEKDLVETNPCLNVKKPNKEVSRDRVLSQEEIARVWQALNQLHSESGRLLQMILLSAQRSAEVKHMRWCDLDLKSSVWTIPGDYTKNGRTHRVPLTNGMLSVIETQSPLRFQSPWVFPCRIDKTRAFQSHQKAIQQLKVKSLVEFRGHDFRRTAATRMASMGVARLVITKLLNHSDSSITNVYDRHGYEEEKRQALNIWQNYLYQAVSGEITSPHGHLSNTNRNQVL